MNPSFNDLLRIVNLNDIKSSRQGPLDRGNPGSLQLLDITLGHLYGIGKPFVSYSTGPVDLVRPAVILVSLVSDKGLWVEGLSYVPL